jgi:hypothetical protein
MKITFKKYKWTGLATIANCDKENYNLSIDGERVGSIWKQKQGYFWAVNHKGIYRNTVTDGLPFSTLTEVKTDCKNWIKATFK